MSTRATDRAAGSRLPSSRLPRRFRPHSWLEAPGAVSPRREELAKKEMQNEMFLDKIIFAVYDKYTKTVKSSTNLEIGVLNMQKSNLYRDLIAWLKTQSIWNE